MRSKTGSGAPRFIASGKVSASSVTMRAEPPPASSTRPARALVPPQSTTTTRPRSRPEGWCVNVRSILSEPPSPARPWAIWAWKSFAMA